MSIKNQISNKKTNIKLEKKISLIKQSQKLRADARQDYLDKNKKLKNENLKISFDDNKEEEDFYNKIKRNKTKYALNVNFKKNYYSLLSFLVHSGLLLLQNTYRARRSNNRHFSRQLKANEYKIFSSMILEPSEFIKSIKQLIRTLQYVKSQKTPMLYINLENNYTQRWFVYFYEKSKVRLNPVLFPTNFYVRANAHNNATLNLGKICRLREYKKLFAYNLHIIHSLNTIFQKKDYGTYKIFADLNDWKKIMFLFILIKNTYKKTDYEKNTKV